MVKENKKYYIKNMKKKNNMERDEILEKIKELISRTNNEEMIKELKATAIFYKAYTLMTNDKKSIENMKELVNLILKLSEFIIELEEELK